jgi:hypothetical protein
MDAFQLWVLALALIFAGSQAAHAQTSPPASAQLASASAQQLLTDAQVDALVCFERREQNRRE